MSVYSKITASLKQLFFKNTATITLLFPGDSLTKYSYGMKFSTRDKDLDTTSSTDCATSFMGAWWFKGKDLIAKESPIQYLRSSLTADGPESPRGHISLSPTVDFG